MRLFLAATLIFVTLYNAPAYAVDDFINPEISSPVENIDAIEAARAKKYMISAANPLAAEAGAKILSEGGSAIDAAIATQMVLNVVEPQSSGIGGGGFMLYWDASTRKLHVYDGRETAPADAQETQFLDESGKPMPFMNAVRGGLSVGTPGLLKMLELAHRNHGHVEWTRLFSDAMRLSKDGFALSPRLHNMLLSLKHIRSFPESLTPYTHKDGSIKDVGEIITNKSLHDTLAILARKGIAPFYQGEIASAMVDAVQDTKVNPGHLSLADLKSYKALTRDPVCAPYREYRVCSMPPPSSGGVTVLQALMILERLEALDIRTVEPLSVDAVHAFAEASKLAYADRNRYLADPDFVDIPLKNMLNANYLASRAATIHAESAMPGASAGSFTQSAKAVHVPSITEPPSTTHISIIDMQGNAVALTSSIEQGFGSGMTVRGFLLNNQLTDFSFSPTLADGVTPHPNRVEPGKRPRSSMSPTMIFDKNDKLVMVLGSPGGARIIEYVLQTIIAVIDWNLDVQQAINLPHYLNMNDATELEASTAATALQKSLEARGHTVKITDTPSGIHAITRFNNELIGGADPRREGVAKGK
ncbi:MAG: gamma-glutamyltransferase [Alphaproteobacteria bacterium]|nr:gamma-glutamyltransferase [Alphaproteobacteria bacterium]